MLLEHKTNALTEVERVGRTANNRGGQGQPILFIQIDDGYNVGLILTWPPGLVVDGDRFDGSHARYWLRHELPTLTLGADDAGRM